MQKNMNYILYRLNILSVAFDDEAKFSASGFVQNHLFNFNISYNFFSFYKILVNRYVIYRDVRDNCRPAIMECQV